MLGFAGTSRFKKVTPISSSIRHSDLQRRATAPLGRSKRTNSLGMSSIRSAETRAQPAHTFRRVHGRFGNPFPTTIYAG